MKRLLALVSVFLLLFQITPIAFATEADELPNETSNIVWTWEDLQNNIATANDGDTIYLMDSICFGEGEYCVGTPDKTLTLMFDSSLSGQMLFWTTDNTSAVQFQNLILCGDNLQCTSVIYAEYGTPDIRLENVSVCDFSCSIVPIFNCSTMQITGCDFARNTGKESGHIYNKKGSLSVVDSSFSEGIGQSFGGAINSKSSLQVEASTFTGNSASFGGAIYSTGECFISKSTLTGNNAKSDGGAICNGSSGDMRIVDCEIYGNTADFSSDDIKNTKTISINYTEELTDIYTSTDRTPYGWVSDTVAFRHGVEERIDYSLPLVSDAANDGFLMLRFAFEDEIEIEDGSEEDNNTPPETDGDIEDIPTDTPDDNTDTTPPEQEEDNPGTSTPPEDDSDTEPIIPDNGNDTEDTENNEGEEDTPTQNDRPTRPRPSRPIIIVTTPTEPETVFSCNGAILDTSVPLALAGYGDGLLHEEDPLTRAQAAQLLYRLLTKESRETLYRTDNGFNDVAPTAWYNEAVSTIANAGIVVGYGESYHPDDNLTWAQLLTILSRFVEQESDIALERISAANHWAYHSIKTAVYHGWIEDTAAF